MVWSFINAIKGAILYTNAGASLEKGDIDRAQLEIEKAGALLGERVHRQNNFYFYLRSAEIYFKAGEQALAVDNIRQAMKSIENSRKLSKYDRQYLLDYCDHFIADVNRSSGKIMYRIHTSEYHRVKRRLRREFPISWIAP